MTTVNISVGTTVFVPWYGKVVEAEVIERKPHCDWPPFAEWVPVLMSLPNSEGKPIVPCVRNVCMFHQDHVYATADEARAADNAFHAEKPVSAPVEAPTVSDPLPTVSDHSTKDNPSEAWQLLQDFKAAHWDTAHNHLQIEYLDAFYQMWRNAIAAKKGIRLEPTPAKPILTAKLPQAPPPPPVPCAATPLQPQPIEYHKPQGPIKATQLSLLFD